MIVVGAGGHGKVIVALAKQLGIAVDAVHDDNPVLHGASVLGVPVQGSEPLRGRRAVLAIGNNRTRQRLAGSLDAEWTTLVHPRAFVDPSVKLGPGTVVFAGAVIQPDGAIGAHAIVNTGACVDHDAAIGDFVHLAPGVHLAGTVTVEEGAFVGVGTAVIPGRNIGAWATLGAGSVVVRDIPPGVTAFGVPARVKGA